MSYAAITFRDKNPIKRWLQQRRLVTADKLWDPSLRISSRVICDFGAGNGELCKRLTKQCKDDRIICYEPVSNLLSEAQQNLNGVNNVEFCQSAQEITPRTIDVLFCLEVFEHLPAKETVNALRTIFDLLKPEGIAIIGVPVEIGIPAFYKGLFRMMRRYGAFDANAKNVIRSFFGYPPKNRPISQVASGFEYHFAHTGFDFRDFKKSLCSHFQLHKISTSPFSILGPWIMPEIYFTIKKTKPFFD